MGSMPGSPEQKAGATTPYQEYPYQTRKDMVPSLNTSQTWLQACSAPETVNALSEQCHARSCRDRNLCSCCTWLGRASTWVSSLGALREAELGFFLEVKGLLL